MLCRPVAAPPVINDRSPARGFSGVGASKHAARNRPARSQPRSGSTSVLTFGVVRNAPGPADGSLIKKGARRPYGVGRADASFCCDRGGRAMTKMLETCHMYLAII